MEILVTTEPFVALQNASGILMIVLLQCVKRLSEAPNPEGGNLSDMCF